jgi:WD40 repeat protein
MDPALGELFISCSDDQTARVYDPQNGFKLLFTFSTSFINEWHTLTYLALEKVIQF